jgi:hypothetical protein
MKRRKIFAILGALITGGLGIGLIGLVSKVAEAGSNIN